MNQKIAIIGAGKVAHSLVPALVKCSYNVVAIHSRSFLSAKKLAQKYSVKHPIDSLKEIPTSVRIFLLSVPDNEIKRTARKLSRLKINFTKSYFVHFSGVEDISVLRSLERKGAPTGSLHLMQTFPSKRITELKGVHAALETDDERAHKLLMKLSKNLQLKPFSIRSEDKVYYHLAGVLGSNFLAGNLYKSEKLLSLCGIDKKDTFEILKSTIFTTIDNTRKFGAAQALSGPVDRGDFITIKKHISALKKLKRVNNKKEDSAYFLRSYLIQSLQLLNLVEIKIGTLTEKHLKIKNLIMEELNN
ncbi:MAG: DUF2520 domain-containing protein [Ignavibacteriaceae bacterium]|nr:DUF2520 domain-containing protein [Ignavibacteriaceae bacterium]